MWIDGHSSRARLVFRAQRFSCAADSPGLLNSEDDVARTIAAIAAPAS